MALTLGLQQNSQGQGQTPDNQVAGGVRYSRANQHRNKVSTQGLPAPYQNVYLPSQPAPPPGARKPASNQQNVHAASFPSHHFQHGNSNFPGQPAPSSSSSLPNTYNQQRQQSNGVLHSILHNPNSWNTASGHGYFPTAPQPQQQHELANQQPSFRPQEVPSMLPWHQPQLGERLLTTQDPVETPVIPSVPPSTHHPLLLCYNGCGREAALICRGCHSVYYCQDRACQKNHWMMGHQYTCQKTHIAQPNSEFQG